MPKIVDQIDLANTSTAYYAPATVSKAKAGIIHVSGQPGSTKDGHVPADYESQIHLALLNLRKILLTAGAGVENILKLTVFIVNYDPNRRLHTKHIERFLRGHRPAITLVPVQQLAAPSWLFEVDAVIALPESKPAPRMAPPSASRELVDVVVVGAGLAGLTAARELLKAGLSCVVLEARDRLGGKTWSQPLADGAGVVDLGAAWINDTNQSKVYELAKTVGAEVIEQNTTGNVVAQAFDGSCFNFAYGELPKFSPSVAADIARIRDMCEADCHQLDVWKPKDTHLDSLTFEAYLRSRGATDEAVATARVWTRAMLGQEPKNISAMYFLNYCVSGGGLLQMRSDRKHGGQYLRIRQGMQCLAKGLAAILPEGIIRLSHPVTSVTQQKAEGTVEVSVGDKLFVARKVITTVPSPVLKSIAFNPPLPLTKQLWYESTTYGYYTKAMMVFRRPFWVEKGFCGLTQSFIGPSSVIRDTSSPADCKHILTCFMAGEPGMEWAKLSTPERETSLLAQIGKLFGVESTIAGDFIEMVTFEWTTDEYSGWGCPCTSVPPGVLDSLGGDVVREPCGNLHFAGTETAGEWKGYMEGAIRSGERAVEEVVKDLKNSQGARL
ncbi:hypothetical protein jhhlp_002397 [Lomentospora prolificans]|uniref:Amine oxidase n=1 Tax=Lomentospora prolificans TaxID=41688 RepID=A0A2N3NE54_9PEZI|nr:hypothetical protein jhhlp_002397 [Lomentospora prolificans]